jgi:hypothetical protein
VSTPSLLMILVQAFAREHGNRPNPYIHWLRSRLALPSSAYRSSIRERLLESKSDVVTYGEPKCDKRKG